MTSTIMPDRASVIAALSRRAAEKLARHGYPEKPLTGDIDLGMLPIADMAALAASPDGVIKERGEDAAEQAAVLIVEWLASEGLMRHRTPEDDGIKIEGLIKRSMKVAGLLREDGRRPDGPGLSLRTLHAANRARQTEWCSGGDPEPDLAFRGNELAGEVGEACNVVKKLERERHGWRGSRATLDDLAQELADVVICADLCAVTAGIDLDAAVVAKFNATSEKQGLATMLPRPEAASPVGKAEAPASTVQPPSSQESGVGETEGWALVPREPTEHQFAAALMKGVGRHLAGDAYRAMVEAAPRPSQREG